MENLTVEKLLEKIEALRTPVYYVDTNYCPKDRAYKTKDCYIFHPKLLELFLVELRKNGLTPISMRDLEVRKRLVRQSMSV